MLKGLTEAGQRRPARARRRPSVRSACPFIARQRLAPALSLPLHAPTASPSHTCAGGVAPAEDPPAVGHKLAAAVEGRGVLPVSGQEVPGYGLDGLVVVWGLKVTAPGFGARGLPWRAVGRFARRVGRRRGGCPAGPRQGRRRSPPPCQQRGQQPVGPRQTKRAKQGQLSTGRSTKAAKHRPGAAPPPTLSRTGCRPSGWMSAVMAASGAPSTAEGVGMRRKKAAMVSRIMAPPEVRLRSGERRCHR